jgi:negative regulator of sigma E activity
VPGNTFANITNPMKPESHAWNRLREQAASQLPPDFADRVLRVTHGTAAETAAWRQLHARAATQLRPGFAQRVLLAARSVTEPSFSSQFILSAATAAVCLLAVVFVHQRTTSDEDARNLAGWQEIASEAQEFVANP